MSKEFQLLLKRLVIAFTVFHLIVLTINTVNDIRLKSFYATLFDIDINGIDFSNPRDLALLFTIAVEVPTFITTPVMLYGVLKKKLSFTIPFLIVFLPYFGCTILQFVYLDEYDDDVNEKGNEILSLVMFSFFILVVFNFIYYFATSLYVLYFIYLDGKGKEVEDVRNLEEVKNSTGKEGTQEKNEVIKTSEKVEKITITESTSDESVNKNDVETV